ncbi:MAG TPA: TfuA-like protein [Polyangiaceae bacterium]
MRRGDVERLLEARRKPGLIVIVDGVFHDTLAVGHAEIREALERGWQVWGLSSMGAIRAREMAHLGMRGYGSVYEKFVTEADFQDDEVALLHEPSPPYRPVSEPLVHLRVAAAYLASHGIVPEADACAAIEGLKARWYGERTVRRLAHALGPVLRDGGAALDRELRNFDRFRSKALDLARFLEERPFA